MGLGQFGRVRRREVPRRVVLAPVDENLDSRPAVLLRLRRRRRTSPGPATAWWLRRSDSARAACPTRNLTSAGGGLAAQHCHSVRALRHRRDGCPSLRRALLCGCVLLPSTPKARRPACPP